MLYVRYVAITLTKRYTFPRLRAYQGCISDFHDVFWGTEAAEKQRRNAEPLAHPISCCVEFKIRFVLQTVGIDKVELVNETRGNGYGLSHEVHVDFTHKIRNGCGASPTFSTSSPSKS